MGLILLVVFLIPHLASLEEPHNMVHLNTGGNGTMVRILGFLFHTSTCLFMAVRE